DEIVRRLGEHLAHAEGEELVKMRPFELADRWALDRRAVLAAFLHAADVGLVTMTWEVICPNCRIPKATKRTLRALEPDAHCEVCSIRFAARFDWLVEVRFTASPSIRNVSKKLFCVGGPMNTPHVVGQLRLASGAEGELTIGRAGRLRLRTAFPAAPAVVDVAAGAPSTADATVGRDVEPVAVELAPGGTLRVRNVGPVEAKVMLEADAWPDTVATAAYVSTLPEFR